MLSRADEKVERKKSKGRQEGRKECWSQDSRAVKEDTKRS